MYEMTFKELRLLLYFFFFLPFFTAYAFFLFVFFFPPNFVISHSSNVMVVSKRTSGKQITDFSD